jgi:hypothetical protein
VRDLNESAANFQIALIRGEVPIREIADKLQQRLSQIDVLGTGLSLDLLQKVAGCVLELSGTILIVRVGQQQREQHRAARREGPTRPPHMESVRMSVRSVFLAR